MEENNNNSSSFTKEELLSDYQFKTNIPSIIGEDPTPAPTQWYNTPEGMQNTYLSENLHTPNFQEKLKFQAKLKALQSFLNETVSEVDLSALTIQKDDKGEQ